MPRHVFNSRETDFVHVAYLLGQGKTPFGLRSAPQIKYRLCRKDTPDNDASERPELGAGQLENRDLGATLDALLDIPELEKAVHNNHTTWSVIRTHHREALAEGLGVFVQLTMGFCVDLAVTVADQGNPNTTAWAWGLVTMMAIYICGGVSGAHLNPVVTMVLWFFRGFLKRKTPEYFAARFIAAICAALNSREVWAGSTTAFFNEFIGTTLLIVTILALGDYQNAPPGAGVNSLIIGLVYYLSEHVLWPPDRSGIQPESGLWSAACASHRRLP
ncbi:putative membrane protein [Penicillium chrysogenum]|uniref:Putative membrane protein n=1 Tax=Penicillium chrysogenum TaxID=5076 RepID=A0A161XUW1_PENCH|nr:putative membrane protein [Penicillium chrysogenum]